MAGKNTKGTRNPNGMGNIYKTKSGRYEYRRVVDGVKDIVTASTASELKEKINEMSRVSHKKKKIRVHDWFKEWLNVFVKPFLKVTTYKQYKSIYECYIEPHIKNVYIGSIGKMDIRNIIAMMNEKSFSASTMKQVRKVLNLAFECAVEEEIIPENPVTGVKIPAIQQKARKVLKLEEIGKMFEFLETSRWYWPLRFMLVTGLRRGELLALKWSDIDASNKVITVSDNLTNEGIGTTKSNKVHYVGYSNTAKRCIENFKNQLERENNPAVFNNPPNLIFVSQDGKPLRPQSLNNVFRRLHKATGIEASPHSMRHSFVFYCKKKLTLSELKDTIGHDVTTSTLDIYGDMLFDASSVAGKIDESFSVIEEKRKKNVSCGNVISFEELKKRAK